MTQMDLSILVCTFNRSESLRRMLESFVRLEVEPGLRWQVVVVDNSSTDQTPGRPSPRSRSVYLWSLVGRKSRARAML